MAGTTTLTRGEIAIKGEIRIYPSAAGFTANDPKGERGRGRVLSGFMACGSSGALCWRRRCTWHGPVAIGAREWDVPGWLSLRSREPDGVTVRKPAETRDYRPDLDLRAMPRESAVTVISVRNVIDAPTLADS
ncbi:hypothetical protein GCM10009530_25890 [Microbispora corallina]|uniref:Uncharacterized protein n=1 Tax=Microbispora corallina TaxID=83302 RepID=A0ABQ4G3T4_9ACTN|nr:hypothetical protein Mco01_47420 [Microbispora corallina]